MTLADDGIATAPKRSRRKSEAGVAMAPRFRPLTEAVLAATPAARRKSSGQYFTPRFLRQRLLDFVALEPGMRVLDPGAGTGEFLLDVLERCPAAIVEGFEFDEELAESVAREYPQANVRAVDVLAVPPAPTYDLVIGNPPYYEFKLDPESRARFGGVIAGRPNVFAVFFQVGLDLLKDGGRLAFVVPPSMNNGAYFENLRRHILGRASIERLEVIDSPTMFDGANQQVMLIVLRKGAASERHVFAANLGGERVPLFMERPEALRELLEGHATLAELGFTIRTGRCVWNQHKEKLRRAPEPGAVRLLWSHNIGDGEVVWNEQHPKRPQWVCFDSPDCGPAIVVNRIIGKAGKGKIRAAAVAAGLPFVGENHVNVIRRADNNDPTLYESVLAGLRGERAAAAIRLVSGNTQLSATELTHLVPVLAR
jgi:adenine-specific DNA-methyltransferase